MDLGTELLQQVQAYGRSGSLISGAENKLGKSRVHVLLEASVYGIFQGRYLAYIHQGREHILEADC